GTVAPLVERFGAPPSPPKRLIEPVAAWYVASVLIGMPPPENAAGGRIAFKTGTSYGYRDAWAVGFDGKFTIGGWAGRPDGAPVPGLGGRRPRRAYLFGCFGAPRPEIGPAPAGAQGCADREYRQASAAAAALCPARGGGRGDGTKSAHRVSARRCEPRIVGR